MDKMYIDKFGNKEYKNSKGQYHRLDGPALKYTNGDKWWYKEDKLHRLYGPAIECTDGIKEWYKEWYKEGKCHRVNGPAIEYTNGEKYWWILDKDLKEKDFNSWISRIKKFI